jgi:hypothetical protein
VSAELLSLWNLRDGSALFSPAAAISVSQNASPRAGVFAPVGPGVDAAFTPQLEYGTAPFSAYAALSVFF